MAISRNQLVKELEPGLNALFGLEYKQYDNLHTEIYTLSHLTELSEEEVMLSGFGQAKVKPEGSGESSIKLKKLSQLDTLMRQSLLGLLSLRKLLRTTYMTDLLRDILKHWQDLWLKLNKSKQYLR